MDKAYGSSHRVGVRPLHTGPRSCARTGQSKVTLHESGHRWAAWVGVLSCIKILIQNGSFRWKWPVRPTVDFRGNSVSFFATPAATHAYTQPHARYKRGVSLRSKGGLDRVMVARRWVEEDLAVAVDRHRPVELAGERHTANCVTESHVTSRVNTKYHRGIRHCSALRIWE